MNVLGLAAPNRIRCQRAAVARPYRGSLRLRGLVVDKSPEFLAAARERNRRWIARNPEHARSLALARNRRWPWRKALSAAIQARETARRYGFPEGDVPKEVFARLHLLPCTYCGVMPALEADHIQPLRLGGPNDLANLAAACPPCNRRGGTRLAVVVYQDKLEPSLTKPPMLRTHCAKGHALDEANTRISYPYGRTTRRRCRTCCQLSDARRSRGRTDAP